MSYLDQISVDEESGSYLDNLSIHDEQKKGPGLMDMLFKGVSELDPVDTIMKGEGELDKIQQGRGELMTGMGLGVAQWLSGTVAAGTQGLIETSKDISKAIGISKPESIFPEVDKLLRDERIEAARMKFAGPEIVSKTKLGRASVETVGKGIDLALTLTGVKGSSKLVKDLYYPLGVVLEGLFEVGMFKAFHTGAKKTGRGIDKIAEKLKRGDDLSSLDVKDIDAALVYARESDPAKRTKAQDEALGQAEAELSDLIKRNEEAVAEQFELSQRGEKGKTKKTKIKPIAIGRTRSPAVVKEPPTNRAYDIAIKSTEKDIPKLKKKAEEATAESAKLLKEEKFDEAMEVGAEAQMFREAAEVLEEQPQHAETFKRHKEKRAEKKPVEEIQEDVAPTIEEIERIEEAAPTGMTAEQAEAGLRALVPDIGLWLKDKTSGVDIGNVRERIQTIISEFDPANAAHERVIAPAEQLLIEISKKELERKGVKREELDVVEEVEPKPKVEEPAYLKDITPEARIFNALQPGEPKTTGEVIPLEGKRAPKRKVVEEPTDIQPVFKEIEAEIRSKGSKVTLFDEGQYVTMENLDVGSGTYRDLFKSMDKALVETAKAGKRLETTPSSATIEKFLLDIGGTKEIGSLSLSNEALRAYAKAGDTALKRLSSRRPEPRTLDPADLEMAADIMKVEMDKPIGADAWKARGEKLKAKKKRSEGRKDVEEYRKQQEEMAEFYGEEKLEWEKDPDLYEQSTVSDLIDLFGDERGSFSTRNLSAEKIAALERLRRRAARQGVRFADAVRKVMPNITDASIRELEKAINEIEKVRPEPIKYVDPSQIVNPHKARKYRGFDIKRPDVTVADLKVLKEAKELPKKPLQGFFENPIRTFEQSSSALKEMIYRPYLKAEKAFAKEWKQMKKDLNELKKTIPYSSRKRIGAYAIAQQEGGMKIIESMGARAIPRLTPEELAVYENLRGKYEAFYDRINDVRTSIGKRPLKKVDNYFTFFRTFDIMKRLGDKSVYKSNEMTALNPILSKSKRVMDKYKQFRSTPMPFAKIRRKVGPKSVELDPFRIFERYAETSLRHIHVSPIVAKVAELRGSLKDANAKSGRFQLKYKKNRLDSFLLDWSNHIAGYQIYRAPKIINKAMQTINRNLAFSILGYNLRSAAIQTTALRNTHAEIGTYYTMKGITNIMDPRKYRSAMEKSNVLDPRAMDVHVSEFLSEVRGGKLGDIKKTVGRWGMKPLQFLDMLTARATWSGAFEHAKNKLKLSEEGSVNFADDVVTKTQASALPGDIAPIQRSPLGKFATLFQTFVINDFNFLVKDVVGIKNKNVPLKKSLPKVIRYVVATMLINSFYEDVLGIKSPFPRPIKALTSGMEDDKDALTIAGDVAKELIEPIPLLGNSRYGKTVLGPGIETIGEASKILTDNPFAPHPLEVGGKLAGVPGTAQIAKSIRAKERGEGIWGTAMGTYSEDKGGFMD